MNNASAFVIEDHEYTATIFASALQTAGFEVEIISNGETALSRLKEATPTLVVLDLHLPNVAGREILAQIRKDARLEKIPVILATADPLLANELSSDANLVLIKPISFDQLSILSSRLHPANKV
ncbi:MAG: response regulator [Chloroflexi bacterium]|nr:response regulator [Chloroflexota bacterium]